MAEPFEDRFEAGRVLASRLEQYAHRGDVAVLALPRGGVPVGYEVAKSLNVPLDVLLVRKLGVPGHEELAMGAIASGGVRVLNDEVIESLGIGRDIIEAAAAREQGELERRQRLYRDDRPERDLRGVTVVLVDDGLATGSTMRAAAASVRQRGAARVVVAVPVAAAETCDLLRRQVDEVVCLVQPEPFRAVGLWYHDFAQTTDRQVHELLRRASEEQSAAGANPWQASTGGTVFNDQGLHE
jgi:predicted phosphoribosyltransferase